MKRAVVCGAGGFIGSYMARRLKAEGHHVTGLSRSPWNSALRGLNPCDDYWSCDLRKRHFALFTGADEVYQFACEVGGLGYIANRDNDAEMLRDSTLIDINVLEACRYHSVSKIFFASSACIYPPIGRPMRECHAYLALPTNEFAWQKLFAERLYAAYARNYGLQVRIGRLFNTYGIGMTWTGGREKSVAALCRKVAETKDGGAVEIWGSGKQRRSYTHISDAVEGVWRLMRSGFGRPLNIGPRQDVTISKLLAAIAGIAGKKIQIKYVDGPVGVSSICCDDTLCRTALGWAPELTVERTLQQVYPWIEKQVLDNRQVA